MRRNTWNIFSTAPWRASQRGDSGTTIIPIHSTSAGTVASTSMTRHTCGRCPNAVANPALNTKASAWPPTIISSF